MGKLAIDVVLLPSDEMMGKAVDINRELLKDNKDKIVLDKEKCLPHISLCMGVIEDKDIEDVEKVLKGISKEFSPFHLTAEKLKADKIPTGDIVSGIKVANHEELQKLHETVMNKLWKYLSYDVDTSMFYNPEEVEEVTTYWVKKYADKHENPFLFHPHITVGFGHTDKFEFPMEFKVSTLALCQLGNYCTCRKVLSSTELE